MTHALLLLLAAAQAETPSLTLEDGNFIIRALGKEVREPVTPMTAAVSATHVVYRKNDAFAVWDARGLSVRHAQFTMTTMLPEVALTPKLFAKGEIIANRELIAKGERSKNASALSGSRRLGDEVYFLVRWEDKTKKPWLEALVKVNLKNPKPKPELVGKFDGLTVSHKPIDDRLIFIGDQLGAFVRKADDTWGTATVKDGKFSIAPGGTALVDATMLSGRTAIVCEATTYGKTRIARMDLTSGARRDLAEVTGLPELVDGNMPPLAVVPTNLGPALRNLDTAAQVGLPANPMIRRTGAGILIFPTGKPEEAALYSPERFLKLATVAAAKPAIIKVKNDKAGGTRPPQ